jgi:hypothetical protein
MKILIADIVALSDAVRAAGWENDEEASLGLKVSKTYLSMLRSGLVPKHNIRKTLAKSLKTDPEKLWVAVEREDLLKLVLPS